MKSPFNSKKNFTFKYIQLFFRKFLIFTRTFRGQNRFTWRNSNIRKDLTNALGYDLRTKKNQTHLACQSQTLEVLLHCANFRAICLATPLRNKLHKLLPLATAKNVARPFAETVGESRIEVYLPQRLQRIF